MINLEYSVNREGSDGGFSGGIFYEIFKLNFSNSLSRIERVDERSNVRVSHRQHEQPATWWLEDHPSIKKTNSSLGPCAPKTSVFSISAVRLGPVTVEIIEGSFLPYLSFIRLKPSLRSSTNCDV